MEDVMLATPRPKAHRHKPRLPYVLGACLEVLGLSAAPAVGATPAAPAPGAAPAAPVGCAGQAFSQPFASLSDSNYYTLVQGGEFNGAGEGWELYNGAAIVPAARQSGAIGGVLDLRSGAV